MRRTGALLAVLAALVPICLGACKRSSPKLPGRCVPRKPSLVLDSERDQVKHGPEWKCWPNGMWWSAGTWKKGRKHGTWTWWHENGVKTMVLEWRDGKQHGTTMMWRPSGRKLSEAVMSAGKLHGRYTEWYEENGQRYQMGEYRRNAPCGEWKCWSYAGKPKGCRVGAPQSRAGCKQSSTGMKCPPCPR